MSTKKTKSTNKGGRPKGSKNLDYRVVAEIPPACPHCDKYELEQIGGNVRRIDYAGRTPDGREYSRKEIRRMKCKNCGRHCMKHTYYEKKSQDPAKTGDSS
jgi:transposase-like protein